MTRILLVETASPKRICQKAAQILNAGVCPEPEITVLCRESSSQAYRHLSGVKVCSFAAPEKRRTLEELNQKGLDLVFAFWTGEKQYRRMKLSALRLKATETRIISGDGNEFRLTWKAICRHALFRWRHPFPTDHWDFISPQKALTERDSESSVEADRIDEREQILILQSADPFYVLKALNRLEEKPPFRNPRYTLLCRNRPGVVESFREHLMLHQVLAHSGIRGSWKNLCSLRQRRFDAIVVLMTGDPGYWKIKLFAFLMGVPLRHILIFNEAIECFFFNLDQWFALISHRIQERPHVGTWTKRLASLIIKLSLLPFRFCWLLLVWLRLRLAGLRSSGKSHDNSLRLPPFSGL